MHWLLERSDPVGTRSYWPSRKAWMVKTDKGWQPLEGGKVSRPLGAIPKISPKVVKQLLASAASMEDQKDWFQRNEQAIDETFGEDAELFKKILGATSQGANVAANFTLALKAFKQHVSGEPLRGYMWTVKGNLIRITKKDKLPSGPKIEPYTKALLGDPNAIAVDRHLTELFLGKKKPTPEEVVAVQQAVFSIARELGWEPREVQSALWAFNQISKGKRAADIATYETQLERREDTIRALLDMLHSAEESTWERVRKLLEEGMRKKTTSKKTTAGDATASVPAELTHELETTLQAQAAAYAKARILLQKLAAMSKNKAK